MKSFKHSLLLGAASVLMCNSSLFAATSPVTVTEHPGVQVGAVENKLEVVAEKEPAVTLDVAPVAEVAASPLAVAPMAPVAAPLTVAPVAEVAASPLAVAPMAPVAAPLPVAPVAEVAASPLPVAPVAEVVAPLPVAPVAEVAAPLPMAPMAPVAAPLPMAPMAPVAAPLPVAPVAEVVAAPLPVAPMAPVAAPLTVIDGEAPTTVSAQNRAANAIEELMNRKLEEVPVHVAEENEDLSAHHVDQAVHVAEENEGLSAHNVDQADVAVEKETDLEDSSLGVAPSKKAKGSKKAKLTDAEIAQLKEDGAAKTAARKAAKEQKALGEQEEVISPQVELVGDSAEEVAAPVPHVASSKKAKGSKKAKLTDAEIAQLKEDGAAKTAARKAAKEQKALGEQEEVVSPQVELIGDSAEEVAAPVPHVASENENVAPMESIVAHESEEQVKTPVAHVEDPRPTFAVIVETEVDGKKAISLTATQEHAFNRKNQPEEPTKIIVAPVEAPTAVNGAVADSSEHHDAKATQEETKEEPVRKAEPLIVEGTKNGPEVDVTHAEDSVVNAEHQEAAAEKHEEKKEEHQEAAAEKHEEKKEEHQEAAAEKHEEKKEEHQEAAPTGDNKNDVKKVEELDVKPNAHAAD